MHECRNRALAAIPGLAGKYSLLSVDETQSAVSAGHGMVEQLTHAKPSALVRHTASLGELKPEDVRQLLHSLPIRDQFVDVVWPPERTGARMRFADFVEHYDDLWFPSQDDVWIMGSRRDWLLQLGHEEDLLFLEAA